MVQTEHWKDAQPLGRTELQELLHKKINTIDWKIAKRDVEPFISNRQVLDIWSPSFFHDLTPKIQTKP